MLESQLAEQLKQYLAHLKEPIELVASLDEASDPKRSADLVALVNEIADLHEMISTRTDGTNERRPSFDIVRSSTMADPHPVRVTFAGIPLGHEFTSLALALLHVGGHPPKIDDELRSQIEALPGGQQFETFYSLSCQNCPDVVQGLNIISVINPKIRHTAIDGAIFPEEAERRGVMAVPTVFDVSASDTDVFANGRQSIEQLVGMLDAGADERAAAELNERAPYDVLVVGAGPAGSAAAVYAARKGLRTGVVADRFGGQVLDTMGIENFISVPKTEGPKLGAALEQHVREYDVDVMTPFVAVKLVPAEHDGGYHVVVLSNGATLKARTVVVAAGARWRHLNVPGETDYLNKGVAFCPHCDGPLFKGKRIAVVGGGNSGVEAAIDLAGIAEHVTTIEFMDHLIADDVLQQKLRSLPNVDVVLSAATTEVLGDGSKVNGMHYTDRETGDTHQLDVAGIFVQIGLVPNTDWLEGTLDLSERGEIVIDDRGATSIPGVFAAGDATIVPYKQIVIAMGAGATAGLSAFDYLIRTPDPADQRLAAAVSA